MNFSELFIRRPIMTLLLTISVTAFGIEVFRQLPVNDLPAVDYPVIQVSVTYPGASPETMANTCATPLEQQFLQIPGLDLVTSTNQTGQSTLVLQFALDKSLGDAATDVQAAISRAAGFLPRPGVPGQGLVRRRVGRQRGPQRPSIRGKRHETHRAAVALGDDLLRPGRGVIKLHAIHHAHRQRLAVRRERHGADGGWPVVAGGADGQ